MRCGLCRSRMSSPAGSVEISVYSAEDHDPEDPRPTSIEDHDLCERCCTVLLRRSVASLLRKTLSSRKRGTPEQVR